MESITLFAVVGVTVELVVEIIRRYVTAIDGRLVNLLALAVGFAATYVPGVGDFAGIDERITTGALLAGVSSFFAEAKQRLNVSHAGVD